MVEEIEKKEKREPEIKKRGSNAALSFTVGDMPFTQYKRFSEMAKSEFGNCYWMAIVALMERNRAYEIIANDLLDLKAEQAMIRQLLEKNETKSEVVKTFGGEVS